MPKNYRPTDDKKEIKSIKQFAIAGTGLATFFVVAVFCAIQQDKIDFGPFLRMSPKNLTDLGPRVKFVLQQCAPGLVWLGFCVFYVVYKRKQEDVMMPNNDTEAVYDAKNMMTNSIEQFLMLFTTQLCLVTYLTGKQALNIIPSMNLLYIVGRIFFFMGYPKRRAFGFLLGFEPILLAMIYVGYRYINAFRLI